MNQVEETIQWLFANDSKEMKKICNKEMLEFGGISNMDYDDFYSRVGWDVALARESFDPTRGKTFKDYIYGVIKLSVWKEMKHRNCGKRQVIIEKETVDKEGNIITEKEYVSNMSLDAPVGEEDGMTIGEMLPHKSTIESDFFEEREGVYSPKMEKYLNKLSPLQREVLRLISIGFMPSEILEELHISKKMYENCYNAIHSYKNISILM